MDTNSSNIMENSEDNIKKIIKNSMIEELRSKLTTGMLDNDLKEYTEDEIVTYLTKNDDKLNASVNEMFNDYKNDNELGDIPTAPNDWFKEYLYIHVDLEALIEKQ